MAKKGNRKIRYAVVGLGNIAQVAILPGFENASANSELTALVSDSPQKLKKLGSRYNVEALYSYAQYEECLTSSEVDAVFIALPNHLHREYTVRAARAGVHVLCEKPLATSSRDCEAMIRATAKHGVNLMAAYRLHLEKANMEAVDAIRKGTIGHARIFNSVFTFQVREGDVRTRADFGGGALQDIGVYCINAARYLFQAEPIEAMAVNVAGRDVRFREIPETTGAILTFPDGRLASFVCGFGSSVEVSYEVIGTEGKLRMSPAYAYDAEVEVTTTVGKKVTRKTFDRTDQFGPQLLYFSDCILKKRVVEPSGEEGLADVKIIEAIERSAKTGRAVKLSPMPKERYATGKQVITAPFVKPKGRLVDSK